ncbi:hypothetical protein L2E82_25481 [Cichorium intybus]|uniref:Uncharacterized protein n=1 Tax=Cichorium intybus TaxID=13427 RepID=A0ACB9E376_CICIN|nr:hypothetical protein L2E82_25481 [Cichorium intybus]
MSSHIQSYPQRFYHSEYSRIIQLQFRSHSDHNITKKILMLSQKMLVRTLDSLFMETVCGFPSLHGFYFQILLWS